MFLGLGLGLGDKGLSRVWCVGFKVQGIGHWV